MTLDLQISKVSLRDHARVMQVWEDSVRASHDFLSEAEIESLKPLVQSACIEGMTLYCTRDNAGAVTGFLGVDSPKVEALFVHPDWHGKGIGRHLMNYAISEHDTTLVDVNEQNQQALAFYLHLGFEIASRSEVDGFGKPYPLLHLKLPG